MPSDDPKLIVFTASRVWESNLWMATIAGIGTGLLLCTVAGIVAWMAQDLQTVGLAALLILSTIITLLCLFPGNVIVGAPYKIEVEPEKGLYLFAPLKSLYVPLADIRDLSGGTWMKLIQQGVVVRLNKRHGLLKSFVIHWAFGDEGKQLATMLNRYLAENS